MTSRERTALAARLEGPFIRSGSGAVNRTLPVVISLLIVLGLLIISLVPVAPVAAAGGCWRGTVVSGQADLHAHTGGCPGS